MSNQTPLFRALATYLDDIVDTHCYVRAVGYQVLHWPASGIMQQLEKMAQDILTMKAFGSLQSVSETVYQLLKAFEAKTSRVI